jgi:Lysozyme like domain
MPICGPNQSLTSDQVATLMKNAGFPDSSIPTGVAIAEAESSWQTGNCNPNDPNGGSFGLWQINGIHFLNGTSMQCAFDPQCSTNYAFKLSNGGTDWGAWGTYTSGAYQQYLNSGLTATLSGGCKCDPGDTVVTIGGKQMCEHNGITSFTYDCGANLGTLPNPIDLASAAYAWIKDPTRLIKLIFGILLIGISLLLLINPTAGLAGELAKAIRQSIPNPSASFKKGSK